MQLNCLLPLKMSKPVDGPRYVPCCTRPFIWSSVYTSCFLIAAYANSLFLKVLDYAIPSFLFCFLSLAKAFQMDSTTSESAVMLCGVLLLD